MGSANCSDVANVREVSFNYHGQEITPANVFDVLYSPFDNVIQMNRNAASKVAAPNHKMRMGHYSLSADDSAIQRESDKAKNESFEHSHGLAAILRFDNGKREKFSIAPRTNYDPTQMKRPNILYLECPELTQTFMLREARTYEGDPFPTQRVASSYKKHFRDISVSSLPGTNLDKNDVVFVPEPYLILALEQLRLSGIGKRVTPSVRWLGSDKSKAWIIRNFLPSINDAPVREDALGSYFGTLHGLGLIDLIDSNPQHYCRQGKSVVNVDPDFMVYTSPDSGIVASAWGDTKRILFSPTKGEEKLLVNFPADKMTPHRTAAIDEIKRQLEGRSFLDYIPASLSDAPVLKQIGLEQ